MNREKLRARAHGGPRQLQSRYLRQRLKLLREMYPPPEGYAVFPEELKPR